MPRVVEPKTKTCNYDSTLAQGGWVQALCIGVDEYKHLSQLGNCVRDATAIAQKVQGKCLMYCIPLCVSWLYLCVLVCTSVCVACVKCMHAVHARSHTYTNATKRLHS